MQPGGDGLFLLGLLDHALALVKDREAGVGEEVVGIVFDGFLRTGQCAVEVADFFVAVGHRLMYVGELRIERQRLVEFRQRPGEILLGEFDHTALVEGDFFCLFRHGAGLHLLAVEPVEDLGKNLSGRARAVDGDEPLAVVVDNCGSLPLVDGESLDDHGFAIVVALLQLLCGLLNSPIDPPNAGKAVHHKAIARLLERVEDQLDDQVVGHELAVFEQLADQAAQLAAVGYCLAQHGAGGNVLEVEVIGQAVRLRAFAGGRRTQQHQMHTLTIHVFLIAGSIKNKGV